VWNKGCFFKANNTVLLFTIYVRMIRNMMRVKCRVFLIVDIMFFVAM